MANREMVSLQDFQVALDTAVRGADATTAGSIIDTADFGPGVGFVILVSAYTDGDFTLTFEEGDDSGLSDTGVLDGERVKSLDGIADALGDNARYVIDSNKRYVRASLVAATVTTGATVGILFAGGKEIAP